MLREEKRWTLRDLANRLTELGHPIQAAAIRRIENAVEPVESEKNRKPRRVDVQELMALALAFEERPNRLLLTADEGEDEIHLTPNVSMPAREAWLWASARNIPEATAGQALRFMPKLNMIARLLAEIERDGGLVLQQLEPTLSQLKSHFTGAIEAGWEPNDDEPEDE
jgi:hypothetical protein